MAPATGVQSETKFPHGKALEEALGQRFDDLVRYSEEFFREVQSLVARGRGLDLRREARINSEIVRRVTAKWTVEIVFMLYMGGPMGFESLRGTLGAISSKTLSDRLKTLEELDYVKREVVPGRPVRVRYSLTERGRSIATIGAGLLLYLRYIEGRLGQG